MEADTEAVYSDSVEVATVVLVSALEVDVPLFCTVVSNTSNIGNVVSNVPVVPSLCTD